MKNLLSNNDISLMRKEFINYILPMGRGFCSMRRVVDTLEYFRDIEEKYNKLLEADVDWQETKIDIDNKNNWQWEW